MQNKNFWVRPLPISGIIALIGILSYLITIPFLDFMELKTIDLRFLSRNLIPVPTKVVLAVVDDISIDQEGKWPWSRSKIAVLINKLSDAGAKVIVFDIGFFEPSNKTLLYSIDKIKEKAKISGIKNQTFIKYLNNLKNNATFDKNLAKAIIESRAKIVLGYFFYLNKHDKDQTATSIEKENIITSQYKLVRFKTKKPEDIYIFSSDSVETNIKEISSKTDYSGYFNIIPDIDGVVRRIPCVIKFKDNLYAPLSLSAVSAYLNQLMSVEIQDFGVTEIKIGTIKIPTDELGQIMVNYRGKEKSFPHIPITEILNNKADSKIFKDKIVLIGATATGIYDLRVTPFSKVYPGLEIHANVIENVLKQNFLFMPRWASFFDIAAIIFFGIILGLILHKISAIKGIIAGISLFGGYIIFCQFIFSKYGIILNMVYPLTFFLLTYLVITIEKYMVEEKQKNFIKNAFSTYLAPAVVKKITESNQVLQLGGENRDITAFFSDLQGFTSISEKLTPVELVDLLNEFLTEMTDIILLHEGTVDKFEGDAIIAFFGAPNFLENHAKTTVVASVQMQIKLKELRKKWAEENRPLLKMRIGLCSGTAVVGNMGSKTRMDYTMMGDTVNTAARLEGVNKIYGTYILICESTYKASKDKISARRIDYIKVVGKKEPVNIYEPTGFTEETDENILKTSKEYEKGFCLYQKRDWKKAISCFNMAIKITPDDGPSKTMILRCKEYMINPPKDTWNGSFSMKTK